MDGKSEVCARELMEVVPVVMHSIRDAMRRYRAGDLSVPQFRTLLFIQRNPGPSLSDVAEHLGLTPASTSKKIDGLVARNLVLRQESQNDRRRIRLTLTSDGAAILTRAREETQTHLSKKLAFLPEPEIDEIIHALQSLKPVFILEKASKDASGG
jgi:DNA-binding MarR family transcriptional regulator